MSIHPTIRPLPYYTVDGNVDYAKLAQSMRMDFIPKIKRRLPNHHLCGQRHDAIVNFVKKHKKRYPFFLRTDISKFYPSICHRDMIVGIQIAYRNLLGLDYVPREFKLRYVGPMNRWCKSLPLTQGIPLGSPLSAIAAPLMLLPMWLELKRRFAVPFTVYMDDVLVMCDSPQQSAEIYALLENYLAANYNLRLNVDKTVSGQFSRNILTYCGWSLAGGYAAVSDEKIAAFKERVTKAVRRCRKSETILFIKQLNHKIDGFGNYYKHGNVAKQFATLDMFIRGEVRKWLLKEGKPRGNSNSYLNSLGLHSLELCYAKTHKYKDTKQPTPTIFRTPNPHAVSYFEIASTLSQTCGKITSQLAQILAIQRRQMKIMERIYT